MRIPTMNNDNPHEIFIKDLKRMRREKEKLQKIEKAWLKGIRGFFPRQVGKPLSTKKGLKGYNRKKAKEVLRKEIDIYV